MAHLAITSAWVPSPRAGMLRFPVAISHVQNGSFPACGDASPLGMDAKRLGEFLPRVRGCFHEGWQRVKRQQVPSPRAGMLRSAKAKATCMGGSFPACGDASLCPKRTGADPEFLPRVRGCFKYGAQIAVVSGVPSPRAGMLPKLRHQFGQVERSFPACGDASVGGRSVVMPAAFLPRVRGCFRLHSQEDQQHSVPSPRAGMLLSQAARKTALKSSFPACGDASAGAVTARVGHMFLPRVRGCFWRVRRLSRFRVVPSPRAGMLPPCPPALIACMRSFPACGDASECHHPRQVLCAFLPRVRGCFHQRCRCHCGGRVPSPRAGMLLCGDRAAPARCRSFPACGDASCVPHGEEVAAMFLPRVRGCFPTPA